MSMRPNHLPEFTLPPLTEVVVGVQFSAPKNYQQIHAGKVWDLFKDKYPQVQELPPIPPAFETFGRSHQQLGMPQISFAPAIGHDRFWFLTANGDELIQFQQDRLLHNWRKNGVTESSYPRYEVMITKFEQEVSQLQDLVATLSPQELLINQCEVSYINQIEVTDDTSISDWLSFVDFKKVQPDNFNLGFGEIIRDENEKPLGRLSCEVSLGTQAQGKEVIYFSLTVRGAPDGSSIKSAIQFLDRGRELIVNKFSALTTNFAHEKWGRTR